MSQLLRVQCFNVTQDGFGAGVNQRLERPFGDGADPEDLFGWAGATASWVNRTDPGGSRGLDDYFTRDFANNIGAEIMGRNKFGPQRGPWENLDWKGWWGDVPPFHTPVFVLTHHVRPSFTLLRHDVPLPGHHTGRSAAPSESRRRRQGRATRRRCRDHSRIPRRGSRRHDAHRGLAVRDRARRTSVGVAHRAARPLPSRHGAQPQRSHSPSVLAPSERHFTAYANRLTKSSAVWATSRQPWSIVRAWPRFGIFTISVTPGLCLCRL